jgi:hypothetical protein
MSVASASASAPAFSGDDAYATIDLRLPGGVHLLRARLGASATRGSNLTFFPDSWKGRSRL